MGKQWTEEEDKFLINHFENMTFKEMGKSLTRTHRGVQARCWNLGLVKLKHWSKKELQFIKDNYSKLTTKELCKSLNRSEYALFQKAVDLGLYKTFKHNLITKDILYKEYVENRRSIQDIAIDFNVSSSVIAYAMKQYEIKFNKKERLLKSKHFYSTWKGYGEISGAHWGNIKKSAKERNIVLNINIKYIWELFEKQNRKCAISGIILEFANTTGCKSNTTASLDRIDSSKGYIEDNVQWIHKDINFMKRSMTNENFINFCHLVSKYQGEN